MDVSIILLPSWIPFLHVLDRSRMLHFQIRSGRLTRTRGKTAVLVPSVKDNIMTLLTTSARAAAASCTDGTSTISCGMKWWSADGYDGYSDFGSQLSALEVIQSLLVTSTAEPTTLIPA